MYSPMALLFTIGVNLPYYTFHLMLLYCRSGQSVKKFFKDCPHDRFTQCSILEENHLTLTLVDSNINGDIIEVTIRKLKAL